MEQEAKQDIQQDVEPNTKPRRKWKRWMALLLLLIIGPTQYLNRNGFCYAEMKYLSERDLVGIVSFGKSFLRLSEEQKDNKWKEFDWCCSVQIETEERWLYEKKPPLYWMRLEFGLEHSVSMHRPRKGDSEYPYDYFLGTVDTCGNLQSVDKMGVTTEEYKQAIQRRKNYWLKKEQGNGNSNN